VNILASETKLEPIDAIRPHPRNPREGDVGAIHESIEANGFYGSILAQKSTGFILAGNHRWQAAMQQGATEIPVTWVDVDDDHALRILLADNRTNDVASYNEDELANILQELAHNTGTLAGTGYDGDALDELLEDLGREPQTTEGLTDPDEAPEPPVEPITKPGDLWVLGNHRLLCGDSTDLVAVERLMDGQKAQAVVTDPPYNQETEGGFRGNIGKSLKKQSADIKDMCDFQVEPFLQILPAVHEKGRMNATVFCNKDLVPDYLSWAREGGYSFNILVWKKPSAIPLGGSYIPDIEYCLVFRKSGVFNTKVPGVTYSKVLNHNRETGLHPTMKPVAMLENQIQIVSDMGSIVLDLFGGSGSTLIACEKTTRHCRMIELDPAYCDVIVKRWEDYTGQKAHRQNA